MSLRQTVKASKYFEAIYVYLGSLIINIFKPFIRTRRNLILFVSFGGKYYNDSPKAIYESMLRDRRYKEFDMVWAFENPKEISVPGKAEVIKIDSLKYFLISLQARVWISNSPVERRLRYKGKHTYFYCTWHGTPLKKIGKEISKSYTHNQYDILCAQGEYDKRVFKQAFNMKEENVVCTGLPRNDILTNEKSSQNAYKEKLNIPIDKIAILYCPTYRDWKTNYFGDLINFNKWEEILGDNYIILFRAHSKVASKVNFSKTSKFVYDVSSYHDLNDLMIASDMLITDYSSIMFDYSILEKPIVCYTYDYEEYALKRGVYFDIRKELPGGEVTEDELLSLILNKPKKELIQKVKTFKHKYVDYYGHAIDKSLDIIYEYLRTNKN